MPKTVCESRSDCTILAFPYSLSFFKINDRINLELFGFIYLFFLISMALSPLGMEICYDRCAIGWADAEG
jgi:hypothetical protein